MLDGLCSTVSIPLWYDSNKYDELMLQSDIMSQFHYGMIQIYIVKQYSAGYGESLNSTMV